jgi:hypothetical protein
MRTHVLFYVQILIYSRTNITLPHCSFTTEPPIV